MTKIELVYHAIEQLQAAILQRDDPYASSEEWEMAEIVVGLCTDDIQKGIAELSAEDIENLFANFKIPD